MNVIPIRKCKCGKLGNPVDLYFGNEPVGEFLACADCLEEDRVLLDRVRPIFDQMLAAGVSREIANETMTYMLEKMEDP